MSFDYKRDWGIRLGKIIKVLKSKGVEVIKNDKNSFTVDIICSYKKDIKLLKLLTDKENQYTLEMENLTKNFKPYYHVISNLKQALEIVVGDGTIKTKNPKLSLHKHLQKVSINNIDEREIAFNKFLQWRK
jgi:predicted transcriptional regulator